MMKLGTEIVRLCVTVRLWLSVTLATKVKVLPTVAVPVIAPLLLKESPAGREPAEIDHVYGGEPPVAANVWLQDVLNGQVTFAVVIVSGPMTLRL
jgi:hypothetical protein